MSTGATTTVEDTGACAYCGPVPEGMGTQVVCVTSGDGGAHVRLCDDCIAHLRATRCGLCGAVKSGRHRADHVVTNASRAPICDDCNDQVIA